MLGLSYLILPFGSYFYYKFIRMNNLTNNKTTSELEEKLDK